MSARRFRPYLVLGLVLAGALLLVDRAAAQGDAGPLKPGKLKDYLEDLGEEPMQVGKEANLFSLNKKLTVDGVEQNFRLYVELVPDNSKLLVSLYVLGLPNLEATPSIHLANLLRVNNDTLPAAFVLDTKENALAFRLGLENRGLLLPVGKRAFRTQLDQAVNHFAKYRKFWDIDGWGFPGLKRTYSGFTAGVNGLALSADGKLLAGTDGNGTILVREVFSGKVKAKMQGNKRGVVSAVFLPDGKGLITGEAEGILRLWELDAGKPSRTFEGHKHGIWAVVLSKDGTQLVSAGGASQNKEGKPIDAAGKPTEDGDYVIRVWDVATGKEVQKFAGHTNAIRAIALSPEGKKVLSGSTDKTVRVWDVETGKELHSSDAHGNGVEAVAITRDGRGISAGVPKYDDVTKRLLFEKTIRVWDLETGKEVRAFGTHTVWGVSVSSDGKRLLTGGPDKTLRLWDLDSGKELKVFGGHRHAVFQSAFLPGDRLAVSGSYDKTLRVWDLAP
jgi:hypothetical protein